MVKYLLIVLLFIGCATVQPVCRHDAMYNAYVMSDEYPVRIAMGYRNGNYHSQAQAQINGKWKYVGDTILGMGVVKKHSNFNVTEYFTLQEFVRMYICN